ncbi:hypothetical protein [Yeosuana marina]|uniref:hypothetical protein n=1 Tax=Yeosuana marina TaxID=1565536 RepID=UPI00142453B7|nr:hypothetical protein [Yeosuana marina]
MKKTWYFGAFLILFTLLGFYQNQISEPNQEIVLKFSDVDITSEEAQNAILIVKKQLQALGVDAVQVQELKAGQLKITYYSDEDVESIKKMLSEDSSIQIGDASHSENNTSSFPSNKRIKNYKLDVFEINKTHNTTSGLDGKCVLNFKQDYDRFHNPKIYLYRNDLGTNDTHINVCLAFKVRKYVSLAIDNTSRSIPEVRAGPNEKGIV